MFGKKFEITDAQVNKLNSLLPKEFQREKFYKEHFNTNSPEYLIQRTYEYFLRKKETAKQLLNQINQHKKGVKSEKAKLIKIFNTELFEASPLGMIDVGVVNKFTSASTGDRFSNGMIGYAIEGTFDETWAKSNAQFKAVEASSPC